MSLLSREAVIARVTEIAEDAGRPQGIEVVDVEFAGAGKARVLRIFIDKEGGVTHSDCEFMSRGVESVLDTEDLIPGDSYNLEVSSPGIERKLRKPADFQRFTGQRAKVVLTEAVENQKHWRGTLRGMEGDSTVLLEPAKDRLLRIPLANVRRANLEFEW
ncbi:MAG TPA: ribosome maturation factor RimP [Bryobacteraceae bacterium]|nr:ribosome maturation factor RimP [Bryobacteraceae bacterium]